MKKKSRTKERIKKTECWEGKVKTRHTHFLLLARETSISRGVARRGMESLLLPPICTLLTWTSPLLGCPHILCTCGGGRANPPVRNDTVASNSTWEKDSPHQRSIYEPVTQLPVCADQSTGKDSWLSTACVDISNKLCGRILKCITVLVINTAIVCY